MPNIFFDDSLEAFVGAIVHNLGEGMLDKGVVLRDATGLLSFVCPCNSASDDSRATYEKALSAAVGAYGRDDGILLFMEDAGAKRLLDDKSKLYVQVGKYFCHIIDRRIVGTGWLHNPTDLVSGPLRFVFASLKGGVGRSTAIAVTASDFAAKGRNVLVVDLDLEAPGIGDLMLDKSRTPKFGVIDYLVENGIGGVPRTSLEDFVGTSALTTSGGGRIDVVPALGLRSTENPQNILPKLARAMTDDIGRDGSTKSVGDQISEMISRLVQQSSYDVVLIDSRAGLSELTAPAVLGLGAIVLLFGTAQTQTIAGYRALFSSFKLLAMRDLENGSSADWRLLFRPVWAKASLDAQVGNRFAADLYDLFAENLYDRDTDGDSSAPNINFSADDVDAPHQPLVIPFNQQFVDFDSGRNQSHLAQAFYEQTYRPFLDRLEDIFADFTEAGDNTEPAA